MRGPNTKTWDHIYWLYLDNRYIRLEYTVLVQIADEIYKSLISLGINKMQEYHEMYQYHKSTEVTKIILWRDNLFAINLTLILIYDS